MICQSLPKLSAETCLGWCSNPCCSMRWPDFHAVVNVPGGVVGYVEYPRELGLPKLKLLSTQGVWVQRWSPNQLFEDVDTILEAQSLAFRSGIIHYLEWP